MPLNVKNYILTLAVGLLLFSCGSSKQDDLDDDDVGNIERGLDSQKISAQNVFNTIPSRDQIIALTSLAQSEYNPQVLNDPNSVNKYSMESSKALNLGAYGADLNVTGVYEQTQESFLFLKCVNILAKSLGVSNAFDEKMIDRMTANKSNRDSTLEIVSQSFKSADKYLKENGRPGTSSLIVAGAWIEGIYLACSTAKETRNEAIVKEIFGQTESLKYLIQLLQQSKISEDATYILTDLMALKAAFDAKTDKAYTIASLTRLDKAATALRTKVISGK